MLTRYPPIMYGETGAKLKDSLWRETLEEFEFSDVQSLLEEMKES